MNKNNKRTITILFSALLILLVIILLNLGIHIYRTNAFNKETHKTALGENQETISVELANTGTWDKEDALVDGVTNGGTYSFTISNKTEYPVRDWSLKINIKKECYLNQAWNGTVEIHQNVSSGNEKVETLDLHSFDIDYANVTLEYKGEGSNDMMIHLYEGDFVIYHPSDLSEAHEIPLRGDNESVGIGLIFYYNTSLDFDNCVLTYYYGKEFTQGAEFIVFCVLSSLWVILLSMAVAWLIVKKKDQKELDVRDAMLNETIGLITSFVDAKDTYTNGHSTRVAEYTDLLTEKLNLDKDEKKYAHIVAILHDIGKCYVPDEILKKPGKLTQEEFDIMKTHTTYGAEMLKNIKSIPGISDGAHYHHERYDGKGYPSGLKGTEIPYIARIICVADSFDAMTSLRCYRNGRLSREKVLSELENNMGKQFDPDVAQAMIDLINEHKIKITDWY